MKGLLLKDWYTRARGFDAELLHRGLEHLAILTALDRIEINADEASM